MGNNYFIVFKRVIKMDIQDLTASLSVLHHNGVAFNIEERFQLEIAM